jgi:hypothetical protein
MFFHVHVGTAAYGKCDVVPGIFHVATRFLHVYFIPCIPKQSNLYVRRGVSTFEVPIRLSWKSVLLAWARTATLVAAVAEAFFLEYDFLERGIPLAALHTRLTLAIASALLFTILMLLPRRRLPSYRRACQLAHEARLDDRQWAALNVLYNRHVHDRSPDTADVLTLR